MLHSVWSGVAGKRVVITGASSGIGLAAARELAARGAEITIVARSPERGAAAATRIASGQRVDVLQADLASQASIRALGDEILRRYPSVDVLVNNAGALYSSRQLSKDGIELTWAVNHLAPFLLTALLLEQLKRSAPARIITTSSGAHYRAQIPFDDLRSDRSYPMMGYTRYGESKLANILFTRELARRLEGTGVTANCFHPGFVSSGFGYNNDLLMRIAMWISHRFARSVERGADTLVWLADSPDVDGVSGGYFYDRREIRPSPAARDAAAAQRLWAISEEQTNQRAVQSSAPDR